MNLNNRMSLLQTLLAVVASPFGKFTRPRQTKYQKPVKTTRSRGRRGNYGEILRAHFSRKGICWSAKPNKFKV